MTPLIRSRSLSLALALTSVLVVFTGIALLVGGFHYGFHIALAGGFVGAVPLADLFRCPPPESIVRPFMRLLLIIAGFSAVASLSLSLLHSILAIPALAIAMLFGSISGFYFGIRARADHSESTKPVEPTGTRTAHD